MCSFTAIRTVRFIASIIAFAGMLFLLIQRILASVLQMATEALQLALARYNNFTGRWASQNFAEDKQLLGILHEVENVLPVANTGITILLVLSIFLLVFALLGLAFPRQMGHFFVAMKLLRWTEAGNIEESRVQMKQPSRKVIVTSVSVFFFLFLLCFAIRGCVKDNDIKIAKSASLELTEQASVYINAQRSFFNANKKVGGPRSLQLPDSLKTENFTYKVTASRFTASLNNTVNGCAAGNKWVVASSTKGFFTQELILARIAPKDTSCVNLVPDFKNIGRNRPNANKKNGTSSSSTSKD